MVRKKVLYIFKRPVVKDLKKARRDIYPKDFFYGAANSNRHIKVLVNDDYFANRIYQKIQSFLYIFLIPLFRIGFSIVTVMTQVGHIRKSDLVFATVDTVGLPLLMLRTLKVFSKPVIVNTGGLSDSLIESNSKIYTKLTGFLLGKSDTIISGASHYECLKLSQLLSIPIKKFKFVGFGIDTGYFKPVRKKGLGRFVLVIGADLKRDWGLVKSVAEKFPNLNFTIITTPNSVKTALPANCYLLYNQPIDIVRQFIRYSKFVLIPSFQNYHFAGQSTAFRAMSCAKTVLFTKSYGVFEYKIANYRDAILARPSNLADVIKAFNWINKNEDKLDEIGKRAREYIVRNCNYKSYEKNISKIILKQFNYE